MKNYLEEMTHMKDWIITIIDFRIRLMPENGWIFEDTKDRIVKYHTTNDSRIYKGFKETYRTMNEWARHLNPAQQAELNGILRSKFGKDLSDATDKTNKKLAALLKKGKITTEEEYRIVEARIDEIFQDETKRGEVEAFNALLIGYHNMHKK